MKNDVSKFQLANDETLQSTKVKFIVIVKILSIEYPLQWNIETDLTLPLIMKL